MFANGIKNEIKRSTSIFGADQGIKTKSEWLISTNQHIFSDIKKAWLHFCSFKSRDQELRNRGIKWSRTIFTYQNYWSWSQTLLQVICRWLLLGYAYDCARIDLTPIESSASMLSVAWGRYTLHHPNGYLQDKLAIHYTNMDTSYGEARLFTLKSTG